MNHEKYIQRCLQLAKNGIGTTRPNPSVGAVIVYDNKIIGEGYTSAYGGPHAEVNAINSVKNQDLLKKSIIYVTLEPCSHHGKTPPCADLIREKKIPKVVIGCLDTNSLVAGKGIERLKKAGCNVVVGVLEEECFNQHKRFFTVQNKQRPYIILKWAESKDGFIAPETKDSRNPVWISNSYSQQLVHKFRAEEHAILVGTNTVLDDNPKLNVRSWYGNNPVRIILDRGLKIPKNSNVFDASIKTIVLKQIDKENNLSLSEKLIVESIDFAQELSNQICEVLQKHKIQSVIIEGGRQTIQTFIDANLWDEAYVFIGNSKLKKGVEKPNISALQIEEKKIDNDILRIYKND
ncbi:bifunctional diaminohydroxyphosphoribosylaminopyrimidine deaminase/5-amino-6-(5-phosphoribosylamino)uracil reductase RibD [Tenacibaculum sp. 190524A02b]|uniref:bifunctional diaminohydroxyphosphoribosylaminopyrimidine deaminase/5-amino-6-(5-phosphoribosylamino)uracil reductase RibD n=1 Tax=Tenacibaculum vairaonense TaxID=3137860 RepID=UPI0031FA644F